MENNAMRLLDIRGYIYTVYDLGNGRVLKKEKPKLLQYCLHLMHWHMPWHVEQNNALSRRLTGSLADLAVLGNPKWLSKHAYTQDKVTILEHYFTQRSFSESTRAIDAYIQCVFDTWKNGFSDVIFNFSHNNGIQPDGTVILLDFNEIVVEKEAVAERIRSKRWLRTDSLNKHVKDEAIKAYFREAMEKAMTLENLDKYWKDNEKLLERS